MTGSYSKSVPIEHLAIELFKELGWDETTPDFKLGWRLFYRLDKRAYQGEGPKVISLASLVTGPGVYYTTVDRPKDDERICLSFLAGGCPDS